MEEELCKKCNNYKPFSYFIKKDKKVGLRTYKLCKDCRIKARETAKSRRVNILFHKRVQQGELKCLSCKRWKPANSFTKHIDKRFWIGGYCKKCRKIGLKSKKKVNDKKIAKKHRRKKKNKRRICLYCNQQKLLGSFKAGNKTKSGWHCYCKSCRLKKQNHKKRFRKGNLLCKSCKKWKPIDEFGISKKGFLGRTPLCRNCLYIKNRTQRLRLVYGLTPKKYEQLLETQKSACAICKQKEAGKGFKKLHIDHSHSTGAIRGLLCSSCNRGLSCFKDNPKFLRAAIRYLKH